MSDEEHHGKYRAWVVETSVSGIISRLQGPGEIYVALRREDYSGRHSHWGRYDIGTCVYVVWERSLMLCPKTSYCDVKSIGIHVLCDDVKISPVILTTNWCLSRDVLLIDLFNANARKHLRGFLTPLVVSVVFAAQTNPNAFSVYRISIVKRLYREKLRSGAIGHSTFLTSEFPFDFRFRTNVSHIACECSETNDVKFIQYSLRRILLILDSFTLGR